MNYSLLMSLFLKLEVFNIDIDSMCARTYTLPVFNYITRTHLIIINHQYETTNVIFKEFGMFVI